MKTTVAMIGTENNNSKMLAGLLSRSCRLLIFSENEREALYFLNEIKNTNPSADAETAGCKVDASWEAEIIIPAVNPADINVTAGKIKNVVCQKIILVTDQKMKEELKDVLNHSKIVYIPDPLQPRPESDDNEALGMVKKLLGI